MNYGILVAVSEAGYFQIVGEVDSREEANVKMVEYITLGADSDCLAPYEFVIQKRGAGGFYTVHELIDLNSIPHYSQENEFVNDHCFVCSEKLTSEELADERNHNVDSPRECFACLNSEE
jgi:hypothetical protein